MKEKNDISVLDFKKLEKYKGNIPTRVEINKVFGELTYIGKYIVQGGTKHLFSCSCGDWIKCLNRPSPVTSGSCNRCNKCSLDKSQQNHVDLCKSVLEEGFTTPKGGLIRCVHVPKGTVLGDKVELHCSICSEDKELWGHKPIMSSGSQLKRGVFPCGCSLGVSWDQHQCKVRLVRESKGTKYTFLNFVGKYLGGKSRVSFLNNDTGKTWDHLSVDKIMSEGYSDPDNKSELISKMRIKSEDYHLEQFEYLSGYPKGSKYILNTDKVNFRGFHTFWDVTCSACGVTSTQERSSIRRGALSCACKTGGGYSFNKEGYFYISSWGNFIKCGITNKQPKERLSNQQNSSGLVGELCYSWFNSDGKVIYELEASVKSCFTRGIASKELFPDGYTETYRCEDMYKIVDFVENYFGKLNQIVI